MKFVEKKYYISEFVESKSASGKQLMKKQQKAAKIEGLPKTSEYLKMAGRC